MSRVSSLAISAKAPEAGAPQRAAKPRAEGAAPKAIPPSVIRGESGTQQVAIVDWLNCTFQAPPGTIEGFIALLGRMLGRPLSGTERRGMLGFESSVDLIARVGAKSVSIGSIAYGGEAQRGRWLLQFTGTGCALVRDWDGLADLLESLPESRLTRLDLAVDCFAGEFTVDDAVQWHQCEGFQHGGRPPSTGLAGDWLDGRNGRTFYVGKRENGKMLRAYEKGIEQGDFDSEWVRFEVQFGNRDRVIPFEALTNRDAYFAGAYPCLEELVDALPERIGTDKTQGEISMAHLLHHLRRCYGRAIDTMARELACDPVALIEELRIIGFPRRVNPSSATAGVTAADVIARMKGLS